MGDSDEEVVIDIPEDLGLTSRLETCIYRARPFIRRLNEEAYTPRLVRIGPFHYGKPEFDKMEIQKLRYLRLFCKRAEGMMTEKEVVNHFSRIIKDCEEQIRHCYDEPCKLTSSDYVKMVLLDAVFIMELALNGFRYIGAKWMTVILILDLSLIENQLPYFIIERLYEESPFSKSLKFDELMFAFFEVRLSTENKLLIMGKVKHFVDLFRYEVLDVILKELKAEGVAKLKYSAKKLQEAGVKFKPVKHEAFLRLDIKFKKGVLYIPVFEVRDGYELMYRNWMEFEQLHYPAEPFICNYFFFLDNLINTAEDVDLLVDAGILLHWHGSNKLLAEFINQLCQGMTDYFTCYHSTYEELNKHYENEWNHRKATLGLVYFSNLWRGTGTVAAAFLLILTLLQTIASMKSL